MSHPKIHGVRWVSGRPYARVRVKGRFYSAPLGHLAGNVAALAERRDVIAEQLHRLEERGRLDVAEQLAAAIAEATTPKAVQLAIAAIDIICEQSKDLTPGASTVRELGEQWTSGLLARRHPDHVKAKKDTDADRNLLERYVYPVIGDMPVAAVKIDDCERVMRSIPESNPRRQDGRPLSVATRRHIAQSMHRLFSLALYPMRLISESPVPRGFLPKLGPPKPKQYLYPNEDAKLLGCQAVPVVYRLLYGVIAREGLRYGEAVGLAWADLDLERGILRLDKNKTDDPRSWALDPSVVEALRRWKAQGRGESGPFKSVPENRRQAAQLRDHLLLSGVDRSELHETTAERARMRAHDLRATFVTLSLANGRTETWVQDRTGHKSSTMVARYRRAARTLADVGVGPLQPLMEVLSWPETASSEACQTVTTGREQVQETNESPTPSEAHPAPDYISGASAPQVAAGPESAPRAVHTATYGDTADTPIGEKAPARDRVENEPAPRRRSSLSRRTISGALVVDDGAAKGGA